MNPLLKIATVIERLVFELFWSCALRNMTPQPASKLAKNDESLFIRYPFKFSDTSWKMHALWCHLEI